ncbi:hypothetical protein DFR55_14711 [Herbinix hemicellulosilytica]|uniref:DUF6998 domain-containing protein n=1 Tax=Herbinix hemicellulosilytica TaxID=1564487 RepID=A0A0H5SEN6_HERHM|nr:hypothetical protein [Herbinix hemicellulosilytica]NLI58601.1 hypothetical protein [Clostridium sp.]RBP56432.1 hypothetical protein DFR55_14711 [Herbinix hemicellulosilytica]CRZ33927.1 hypothetical protein HHT355_0724 [Herbinix hemicellulosilytica]
MNALKKSGIVRTYNSPVGDYAEWLVSTKMNFKLEKNSKKGYDAWDPETGLKYQIKSRWMHPGKNSRQLNVIRNYEDCQFDYLIAIIFSRDFEVSEAYLIPHDLITKYFPMNTHQNGIVVTVAGDFLKDPEIKDITKLLL